MITKVAQIREKVKEKDTRALAISYAGEDQVLRAAKRIKEEGLADLLLVGDEERISLGLRKAEMEPEGIEIISESDPTKIRRRALELVQSGKAHVFVDGRRTDPKLWGILGEKGFGIRRGVMSYVSLFDSLKEGRLMMFTDTYINNYPDLTEKVAIVDNALELAHLLGAQMPKVAALSALELVNPAMRSTVEAAVLAKMSQRGQFGRVYIEGPLAMDNATSAEAAQHKGIANPVSGQVDIYLVPDVETGYTLVQMLYLLGGARMAGALMGTEFPVVPFIEVDDTKSIYYGITLAILMSWS
ncbi:MAG: phosphate butyryltransferase [Deltaproteobacteria bacterium]|nr:MAG: phosphate butyryltransferase [Deltaproteobacteria bacterium]